MRRMILKAENIQLSEGSKITLLLFLSTCNELLYSKRLYRRLSKSNVPEGELTQVIFKAKILQRQAPSIDQTQKAKESFWLDVIECMHLIGLAVPEKAGKTENLKKLVDLFPDHIAQRIHQDINKKILKQDPDGLAARRNLQDEKLEEQDPLVAITLRCCIDFLADECQKIKDKIQHNYAGSVIIGDFQNRLKQPLDDLLQQSPFMTLLSMSYLPYFRQSLEANDPGHIRNLYNNNLISAIGYGLYFNEIKPLQDRLELQKSPDNQGKNQSYAEDQIL